MGRGDPDAEQFLQVCRFREGGRFGHVGVVVDGGEGKGVGPVSLFVAVVEQFVADTSEWW